VSGESDCAYLESPRTRCRAPGWGSTKAAEKTRRARMLGQRERDEEAERPKQDIAAKVDEEYKKLEKDLAMLDLTKLNSEGKKSLAGWRSHMKILKTEWEGDC
jgi:hypothetical protein